MQWGEWIHSGIGTFEMDRLRTNDPSNYKALVELYGAGEYTIRKQRRIRNKEVEIRYLLCPCNYKPDGDNAIKALKITNTFEELMPYIKLLVGGGNA